MATARVVSSGVACACPAVFVCAACLIACKTKHTALQQGPGQSWQHWVHIRLAYYPFASCCSGLTSL